MRSLVKWRGVAAGTAAATALALGVVAPPVLAEDLPSTDPGAPSTKLMVQPVLAALANPKCVDISVSYDNELYVTGDYNKTYTFMGQQIVVSSSDGVMFNWNSMPMGTFGWPIQAVIVKGGPNANVFSYGPAGAYADDGLHAPVNPSNSKYYGLSHIYFCSDSPPNTGFPLEVEKTAAGTYDENTSWGLKKTVSPSSVTGFAGDSFDTVWTVEATKTVGAPTNYKVAGTIKVTNPNTTGPDVTFSVQDVLYDGPLDMGGDPTGSPLAVSVPVTCPDSILSPGESTTCTYSVDVMNASAKSNLAVVTSQTMGIGGGSDAANLSWTKLPTGDSSVTLADARVAFSQVISDSTTKTFPETFTCPAPGAVYKDGKYEFTATNTATLKGPNTNLSADATVTVKCYELVVTKDALTTFDRDWTWRITKTGDQSSVTLSPGQQILVNYEVMVDAASTDSNWAVKSDKGIKIMNPASVDATINSVSDVISPGINVMVDCGVGVTFPYTLKAGEALTCTYSKSLADGTTRTNTATAVLQNYSYAADGKATKSETTTSFSGSAEVKFGAIPANETDECITVTDDKYGSLGVVCANQAPKKFTYSLYVGPYEECGNYTFKNIASFLTNDNKETGSDDHTVTVVVPCPGCTLTQGYWKTHSAMGPAPYDDAWKNLGALEEDTLFFLSGKTWYQVFWTPPAGNVYFNLAHQYMAATLNVLDGASAPPEVVAALAAAKAKFETTTPAQAATLKGGAKSEWTALASTLDKFNNGLIGPGHCSE